MKRLKLLLAVAGYATALLWAYATVISPAFSYQGFKLTWPDPAMMVWLIALVLLPALALPCALSRPSALILWWLYLAAYIPSILVPPLSLTMLPETLLPLQISLLLSMGILCLSSSGKLLAIGQIKLSATLFWPVFALVWLTCLAFICTYGQLNVLANLASLFAGANEYDIRTEYIAERGRLLGYVVGQLGQALNPFLIAFGIANRRRAFLVAGIIGQIIVFGVTGFKTVVFSAIFLPMVLIFMRRWRRSFGLALTSGLVAIVLICAAADHATGNNFLSSVVTRRTLTVPGLLTGFYFEHFSQVSHAGVGYHFSRNESAIDASREIGLAYFGSTDVDANANLWAQGFADLGLPGIIGFTFIVALMIWMYDSLAAKRNLELAVLLAAMPAIALSNTAPTTVLITHGALAAALLLCLAPSPASGDSLQPEIDSEKNQFLSEPGLENDVAPAH
ncbi:MAG TPA: hypothetical protein VK699_01290 [Terriglobales bacterium]|jgi:hypothetical protein|nr:hypothetical protein [Terriglobales bacterium]